ncbi:MAG: histidinol dehydrogenase, partial [Planctomycetaceae bacterium]
MTLQIPTIDCSRDDARALFAQLREKLSPRGDVVSEAGRRRTVELFGAALSPQQVVERICSDVRTRGLEAVLDYSRRIDGREMTPETLRVSASELLSAHAAADPVFLDTLRRIRANIVEFQRACLVPDAVVRRRRGGGHVELRQRWLPLRRVGICVPGGAAAYPSTVLMT